MNQQEFNSDHERDALGELKAKFSDPNYLPSHREAIKFISDLTTYGELGAGEFFSFCFNKKYPIFDLFVKEYISDLSDYLLFIAENQGSTWDDPFVILEVGAGNGRLTYLLQQELKAKNCDFISIHAVDNGSWNIPQCFPVEIIETEAALKKYSPNIVITAWMLYGEDWTPLYRACESVNEYILIGEAYGAACGSESTWGYDDDGAELEESEFEKDGFKDIMLAFSKYQLCRTDFLMGEPYSDKGILGHSVTVSFKKRSKG